MRWTRMVVTGTLALAAVITSGGRSDAGDLFDRLFRKRPKEATSHPVARPSERNLSSRPEEFDVMVGGGPAITHLYEPPRGAVSSR